MNHPDRILYAVTMALIGVTSVAGGDLLTKNIVSDVSLWQMLMLRSLMSLVILLPVLALTRNMHQITAISVQHLIVRSLLMALSYLLFFSGLAIMPMATVAGGFFSAPFFTVLLAWPLLGERIGLWRIGSVTAGFIGVLMVLRPDTATNNSVLLLPVLGAFSYALTQVHTRKYCKREKPLAASYRLSLCFLATGLLGVLALEFFTSLRGDAFYNTTLQATNSTTLVIFAILGASSLLTHFALAAAYQNAAAGFVSPLEYLYLPITTLGGLWFFNEIPPSSAVFGISIIITVGIVITWREQLNIRKPLTSPSIERTGPA